MIVGVISSEHICQLESGIYDMTTQWYTWRFISNVVSSSWSQSTCMLRRCGRKQLWIVAIHTKRCALYVEHSSYLTNELVRSSNHPFVYFVPEHLNNTLSFESFVDRCCEKTLQYMTWLWFHYDRGIVSCMYGWNWICTWRMVAESTLEYPLD